MKAAAKGYFGKALTDLTLAQFAILAAIPQSPTKFDLVKNADEVCPNEVADGEDCPELQARRARHDSEIVQRRNYVLDLMKTRSPLTGTKHTAGRVRGGQAGAGRADPARVGQLEGPALRVAGPPGARPRSSARTRPTTAREVDTGGYHVTTTLDWTMQKTAEKWVYAAARAPNAKDPRAVLRAKQDPARATGAGSSACAATTSTTPRRRSSTTGPARSSPTSGSASYTSKGNKKFQPQFDVLADGWRQPGSAIKPIDYSIGIDDETLTAVDDVHGRHDRLRRRLHARPRPTSSSAARSGSARRSSSRSTSRPSRPAIMNGLDHLFERTKDFGHHLPDDGGPGDVDGDRDARGPPDRPARRLRHDRQRRRADAAPGRSCRSWTRTDGRSGRSRATSPRASGS